MSGGGSMALNPSLFDLVRTIDEVQTWAFDKVCQQLPRPIARLGNRAVARLAQLDERGRISERGILVRSWFGDEHVVQKHPRSAALPLRLALPVSRVFSRRVAIHPAIIARGEAAIRTRLARVTPLPESEAILVWSLAGRTTADQADIKVWVAHKEQVEQAANLASEAANDWEVVPEDTLAGERCPAFISATRSSLFRAMNSTLVSGLVVTAVVCAVLIAADFRQARALDATIAAREAMLIRAAHLRDLAEIRPDVDAVLDVENSYTRPPSLLGLLQEFASSAASPIGISRMELIDPSTLRVSVAGTDSPAIDYNLPGQETPDDP